MEILFTIDVEVGDEYKKYKNPFELLVKYGTSEILRLLKKYDFVGHFFVDIYSNKICDNSFDSMVKEIFKNSSKAYLHVHPGIFFDTKRPYLHQYSEKEQSGIIEWGITEWKRITGENPLGFRAGSYAANDTTLKILKENGFLFDSSFFEGRVQCKITDAKMMREIPVNGFMAQYSFMGISKKQLSKPDINWMSLSALKNIIEMHRAKSGYMMIFLHSFSFVNLLLQRERPAKVKEFEELLKYISKLGIKSVDNLQDETLKPIVMDENIRIPLSIKDVLSHFVYGQI